MTYESRPLTPEEWRMAKKGCGNALLGCATMFGLTVAGMAGGVAGAEWAGVHVPQVQEAFATGFLAHAGVDVAGGVLGGVAGYGIGLGLTRAVGSAGRVISRGR